MQKYLGLTIQKYFEWTIQEHVFSELDYTTLRQYLDLIKEYNQYFKLNIQH